MKRIFFLSSTFSRHYIQSVWPVGIAGGRQDDDDDDQWSPTFMKNCWRWRRGEVSSAVVGALDRLGLFHTWRQINSSIHSIALPTSCSCYKSWVKTDLRTSSKARSTHLSTQVEEGGVEYSIAQFYLSNCLEDYIELAYFNLECVYLNGP